MKKEKIDKSFEYISCLVKEEWGLKNCYNLEGIDELKRIWQINKEWMFPYFDDNGRIEVNLPKSSEQITANDIALVRLEMQSFLSSIMQKEPFSQLHRSSCYYPALIESLVFGNLSTIEIATNKLTSERISSDGKIINAGAKCFKYLEIKLEERLREIHSNNDRVNVLKYEEEFPIARNLSQIYFSQVVSKAKSEKSTVVLSINPLDIFMSSESTVGWRSCHSVFSGAYSTGPISYMLDDVSAIAYAYSKKKDFYTPNSSSENPSIPNFPVKTWRQMVFLTKEKRCALLGKEYSGKNPLFSQAAIKLVSETLCKINKAPYSEAKEAKSFIQESDVCVSNKGWHYPDPILSIIKLNNFENRSFVSIGAKNIPCLYCGSDRDDFDDFYSPHLFCEDCGDYNVNTCCQCGERVYEDDTYVANYDYYCHDCYYEMFTECEHCTDWINISEDAIYVENSDIYICGDCFSLYYVECDNCGTVIDKTEGAELCNGDIFCEECVEKYVQECDNCNQLVLSEDLEFCEDDYEYLCCDCIGFCDKCGAIISKFSNSDLCNDCQEAESETNLLEVSLVES